TWSNGIFPPALAQAGVFVCAVGDADPNRHRAASRLSSLDGVVAVDSHAAVCICAGAHDDQKRRTSAADMHAVPFDRIRVDLRPDASVGRAGTCRPVAAEVGRDGDVHDGFVGSRLLICITEIQMLNTQKADNRQFCSVVSLYRIWGAYAVGITILSVASNWIGLILFAALVPLGNFAQIRYYRRLSPLFGYGKLAKDVPPQSTASAPGVVTFYGAMGCPFCPIVLERLEAL